MASAPRALTNLLSRLETLSALDGPAGAIGSLVSKVLPEGPIKDAASGTWLGHPLHPLLVSVPLGAWTSASVLDLTAGRQSAPAARRLVGLGVLAAVPTAAAGGSDWADTTGAERRVGLVHSAGAWLSIGFYASSWLARRQGGSGGKLLALAGAGVISATAYLGGHLSYAYGVGVDTTAFQVGPSEWTDVGAELDVSEGGLAQARIDGVAILIARRSGRLYALADRCSHRGGPLSEGELEGQCAVCPWHASAFRLADGGVARGPASLPQPGYDVRVEAGRMQVRRTESRSLRNNPI